MKRKLKKTLFFLFTGRNFGCNFLGFSGDAFNESINSPLRTFVATSLKDKQKKKTSHNNIKLVLFDPTDCFR